MLQPVMDIKIVELKPVPVSASGTRAQGYLGRFTAGTLIGWAVIVPAHGDFDGLTVGKTISVEPLYDHLEDWGPADNDGPSSLIPLATPGDYRLTGTIAVIKSSASIVEAAGFAFDITSRELPKPPPEDGSRVSFTLRGLSLCQDE